ncbi:MAG TPA: AAA family ATPase [Nitrospira sp.]|nr:AAA family ATPase [Nitrospira sp.]
MNTAAFDLPRVLPEAPEAEQAVLGAVLLDASALDIARDHLVDGDFASQRHRRIYRAMLDLRELGESIDNLTLTERLREKGELEAVGGAAYLAELLSAVSSSVNIKSYCLSVRKAAENRRIIREIFAINELAYSGADPEESFARLRALSDYRKPDKKPPLLAALVSYNCLLSLDLPKRPQHLPWLPEGGNVMVYGPRGVGKTFFQLALTVSLTSGQNLWNWTVESPVGVLYVDGEMQLDELRNRTTALMTKPPKASLEFLTSQLVYQRCEGKDLILTSEAMRQDVAKILDARPDIRVLILDNISCLFSGIDESSKEDWEPINAWLIRLRHRGLATVLVHHAGKDGKQRGTSGREDSLDTVIQLLKPAGADDREGCHFELAFTKSRSVRGEGVAPLDVRLQTVNGLLQWVYQPIEVSKLDQARRLVAEGVSGPSDLAEELGVTTGYASKLMKKLKLEGVV